MIAWTHIIIHHSLTKDSGTVSWQAIRRYHVETNGWLDVGYSFGLELVNAEYEILLGRPLTMVGAHTVGMNSKGIGVCVVGDFDLAPPPDAALKVLGHRLLKPLMETYTIPRSNIKFHRDYAPKTCPGTAFTQAHIDKALAA